MKIILVVVVLLFLGIIILLLCGISQLVKFYNLNLKELEDTDLIKMQLDNENVNLKTSIIKLNNSAIGKDQRINNLIQETRDLKTANRILNKTCTFLSERNLILESDAGNIPKHYIIHSDLLKNEESKKAFDNFLNSLNKSKEHKTEN